MPHFEVARDQDGASLRSITSRDAPYAAEEWSAWYCARNAEWDLEECFVRPRGGEWEKYNIEIESVPHFHASKAIT